MHFYSFSYAELMHLPVRTFWFMSDCVDRIQSQHDQRQIKAVNSAQGGEEAQRYFEALSKSVGRVFVIDEVAVAMNAERDEEGFNELRSMAKAMIGS